MNSGKPKGGSADGNPEPSQRYTAGRCRDYLRAAAPLMTGSASRTRPAQAEGEEIVHARRKLRGSVNPLVLGSNPSGPTTISSVRLRTEEVIEYSGELQDYHAMTARFRKPSLRQPGWKHTPMPGARRHGPGRRAGKRPG
jgi:hypothetical protein